MRLRVRSITVAAMLAGAALAALTMSLTGCATARLATEWGEDAGAPRLRTWLVLAAMVDPVKRRLWEDAFTRELAARGVSATPSYRLFPDAFPDTAAVRAKVREGGFDGVLAVRKGAEDERTQGGTGSGLGVGGTFVPFWGMYVNVFHEISRAGAQQTERLARWDAEVYDGRGDGRLLWAGRSDMLRATVDAGVCRDFARTVVARLERVGVVR